ncbi:hypothetical protein EVAR_85434_1 [Eumeta japonica]|uniref:Uncharacterized protein n=1 Tax=Eumeta variegata TaxID=151549 RepID=A0A4C1WL48_EUMVA|nr:hypothetical protein EVAR_85434_1 [Eumeta japonica]
MYGSKSWVWQEKNESNINPVEMRSLRSMCGVSQKNRCRNSDIRERCGLKEDVVTRAEKVIRRRMAGGPRHRSKDAQSYVVKLRAPTCAPPALRFHISRAGRGHCIQLTSLVRRRSPP